MVGWYHQFNGHELGQTPRDGKGQGGLHGQQSMGSRRVEHDLVTEHRGTTPRLQQLRLSKGGNIYIPRCDHRKCLIPEGHYTLYAVKLSLTLSLLFSLFTP